MGSIVQYALQVALPLAAVYLIYKATLASATFHRFNRVALFLGYAMALAAPFLWHLAASEPVSAQMSFGHNYGSAPHWPTLVAWIYFAGVATSLSLTLVSIFRIRRIISRGHRTTQGRYVIVTSGRKNLSPFSWGRYIVLPATVSDIDRPTIIAHETCHLQRWHWLDLAFGQLVVVFNWFNPAAYLMMRELQEVHEYEVDEAIKCSGIEMHEYQLLLLRNAAAGSFPHIADRLSHCRLKSRLRMMTAPRSNPLRRLCAVGMMPALALAVWLLSTEAVANTLTMLGDVDFTHTERSVFYSVDGNKHSIHYLTDTYDNYVAIDIADGSPQPDIFINGHSATRSDVAKLNADNISSLGVDNALHRFNILTR